ncbi:Protein of unknown function [Lactobacillus helveticus CIRM-BIA 953]|uniref:Uncharacterized protein n=1 Tax=Lactobacillus helveticus CIRM-BIA 953 TaxID=1226335 RepID=U4QA69_LACHE|nr:Protein of unknown function [Lactobacillus helveticus CIRM-BIA 953]
MSQIVAVILNSLKSNKSLVSVNIFAVVQKPLV